MQLPPYYEKRPEMMRDAATIEAFERLFAEAVEHGAGAEIEYTLSVPRWQFLCYLTDTKPIVLHGSGDPNIAEFEPRQSNDIVEFGNRRAVYAASDGIWPMYFAIVDRESKVTSLVNACFYIVQDDGSLSEPYYFFSINGDALAQAPWRTGTVYILPGDTFEKQPPDRYNGRLLDVPQWASLVEVKPLAKLRVEPEDFPFLSAIHAHDPAVIRERAAKDPEGFPWLDEPGDHQEEPATAGSST